MEEEKYIKLKINQIRIYLEKSYKYFNIAFTLNPENIELNYLLGKKSYELGFIEKYGEYISNLEILCSGGCEEIDNLKDLASE